MAMPMPSAGGLFLEVEVWRSCAVAVALAVGPEALTDGVSPCLCAWRKRLKRPLPAFLSGFVRASLRFMTYPNVIDAQG